MDQKLASGKRRESSRRGRQGRVWYRPAAMMKDQAKCRLGKAAYWFISGPASAVV
jgi:hypothetical protein